MAEGSIVKPGETVEGRYRIVKALDEGGMGTVFLAEHVLIKRKVAIKVMRPELAQDPDVVERFMNEARAAGTLGHPNIVESTDMGFTRDGVPFIVFEYLEGTLLVDEIYRLQGLPLRRALRIANQIASALHAAHNAGIVHRDLKSENIFLIEQDERPDHVKVLDFGISRFLESESDSSGRGMIMGTPEFMAPEQVITPDKVDRRTDIYALGVILYEMLSARRPFKNDADPEVVLQRVVHDPPPPLTVSDAPPGLVEMIVDKLLAKDPDKRYQSMKDLQGAIEAFYSIHRPTGSITPLSIPVPTAAAQAAGAEITATGTTPGSAAPAAVTASGSGRPRKLGWLWLVAAVGAAAAGLGVQLAGHGRKPAAAASSGPPAALQADVGELAAAIDGSARAARLRAESLATSPMLRAAIETDAPTIRDLLANEHLFAPSPGEALEILQLADGKLHPLVHVPDNARPLSAVEGAGTRLETDGKTLYVVVGAPVTKQDSSPGGAIALATTVDLGAVEHGLAEHALAARLVGLPQPIVLAAGDKPGTAVTLPVALGKDSQPAALSVEAVIAPPAATASRAGGSTGISYAFWGIGGVLLVLYLGTLIRGRREG